MFQDDPRFEDECILFMFTEFSGHVAEVLNSIVQLKEPILLTNNFIQNTLVVVGGEGVGSSFLLVICGAIFGALVEINKQIMMLKLSYF